MHDYVVKEHKSNYPDPIEFNSNDMLEVGAEDMEYPDWIWVRTRDENKGWAPLEYIELVEGTKQGIIP